MGRIVFMVQLRPWRRVSCQKWTKTFDSRIYLSFSFLLGRFDIHKCIFFAFERIRKTFYNTGLELEKYRFIDPKQLISPISWTKRNNCGKFHCTLIFICYTLCVEALKHCRVAVKTLFSGCQCTKFAFVYWTMSDWMSGKSGIDLMKVKFKMLALEPRTCFDHISPEQKQIARIIYNAVFLVSHPQRSHAASEMRTYFAIYIFML